MLANKIIGDTRLVTLIKLRESIVREGDLKHCSWLHHGHGVCGWNKTGDIWWNLSCQDKFLMIGSSLILNLISWWLSLLLFSHIDYYLEIGIYFCLHIFVFLFRFISVMNLLSIQLLTLTIITIFLAVKIENHEYVMHR